MSLTQEEMRVLAIECGAWSLSQAYSFNDLELAAYTAAVEANMRERCAAICDARSKLCATRADLTDDEDDRTDLKSQAWQFSVLASEIRSFK